MLTKFKKLELITFGALQSIKIKMSNDQKSSDFLDQKMKGMDETLEAIGASKKLPKVDTEVLSKEL